MVPQRKPKRIIPKSKLEARKKARKKPNTTLTVVVEVPDSLIREDDLYTWAEVIQEIIDDCSMNTYSADDLHYAWLHLNDERDY